MFSMMALIFIDVTARYVFNSPIPGGSEYVAFLLGLLVFSGFAVVTRDQAHITVGLFDHLIRGRFRWYRDLVIRVANAFAVGFVVNRLWAEAQFMREVQQIGEFLDFEVAPVYYAVALLSFFGFLFSIGLIRDHLKGRDDQSGPTTTDIA